MTSRLAKETVSKWKAEGLDPAFEDIIRLNALGLKVERGDSAYEFGAVPRMAFLGEYVFHEPTVAKRIWLDEALQLVKRDYLNQLCLTAYALHTPAKELPQLYDVREIEKAMEGFRDEILLKFTETQIMTCIEYVLKGDDPTAGEDYTEQEEHDDQDDPNDPTELPPEMASVAKQALLHALSYGIDPAVQDCVTLPHLERITALAALHSGVDVLKGEHAQAVGAFYRAAGRIHERLLRERTKINTTETTDTTGTKDTTCTKETVTE